MESFYDVIGEKAERLTDLLKSSFAPYGYEVREEYSRLDAENPVHTPILTVGLQRLNFGDEGSSLLLGKGIDTGYNMYGRTVTATYRVTVHSSAQYAHSICRSSAAIIAETCVDGVFDVVDITSGVAKYDGKCRCVVMPVDVTIRFIV